MLVRLFAQDLMADGHIEGDPEDLDDPIVWIVLLVGGLVALVWGVVSLIVPDEEQGSSDDRSELWAAVIAGLASIGFGGRLAGWW